MVAVEADQRKRLPPRLPRLEKLKQKSLKSQLSKVLVQLPRAVRKALMPVHLAAVEHRFLPKLKRLEKR